MNAYTGSEPYVFLSYSHKDKEFVEQLIVELKHHLCRVWYDEGLTEGESWNDEVANRIRNATIVVVILTKNAVASPYVLMEVNYAISKGIRILPVFAEEVTLPAGLEMQLSVTQYTNLCADADIQKKTEHIERSLPPEVYATKKVPFLEADGYSFYLKKVNKPNPHNNGQTSSDGFVLTYMDVSGQETELFDFMLIPAYDVEYTVTQCKTINDDFFVGQIRGIYLFNILAKCELVYPLYGPDCDLLLIFALRIPQDAPPEIRLIDYQYTRVIQSADLNDKSVAQSPWGYAIEDVCREKLYTPPAR